MKFVISLALVATMAFASETEVDADQRLRGFGSSKGFGHGDSYAATQPTYGWRKGVGYGVYDMPKQVKPRIANDGYRVKQRTNVGDRVYETIRAKCVMLDPDYNSEITGTFRLIQNTKDYTTSVWGEVEGLSDGKYELTINALGDLRDGCDSTGDVFNPALSVSGYGVGKDWPEKATGDLGSFYVESDYHNFGKATIDVEAGADLSGTWSVIGRSLVVTADEKRVGCCTIGLAAAPKKEVKKSYGKSSKAPVYAEPAYQPYGGYGDAGYGDASYGSSSYDAGYGNAGYGSSSYDAGYGNAGYGSKSGFRGGFGGQRGLY